MRIQLAFLAVLGAGLGVATRDGPAEAKTQSAASSTRTLDGNGATAAGKAKRKAASSHGASKARGSSQRSHAHASHKRGRSTSMLSTTAGAVGTSAPGQQAAGSRRGKDNRKDSRMKVALPARPALVAKTVPAPGLDGARHRQIAVAETAARTPERSDRWESVLFLLSGVDSGSYPAGCFWRVLAEYRLGRLARGDTERPACRLVPADSQTLDAERKAAAERQGAAGPSTPAQGAEAIALNAPAVEELPPVRNNLPYDGPAPRPVATGP